MPILLKLVGPLQKRAFTNYMNQGKNKTPAPAAPGNGNGAGAGGGKGRKDKKKAAKQQKKKKSLHVLIMTTPLFAKKTGASSSSSGGGGGGAGAGAGAADGDAADGEVMERCVAGPGNGVPVETKLVIDLSADEVFDEGHAFKSGALETIRAASWARLAQVAGTAVTDTMDSRAVLVRVSFGRSDFRYHSHSSEMVARAEPNSNTHVRLMVGFGARLPAALGGELPPLVSRRADDSDYDGEDEECSFPLDPSARVAYEKGDADAQRKAKLSVSFTRDGLWRTALVKFFEKGENGRWKSGGFWGGPRLVGKYINLIVDMWRDEAAHRSHEPPPLLATNSPEENAALITAAHIGTFSTAWEGKESSFGKMWSLKGLGVPTDPDTGGAGSAGGGAAGGFDLGTALADKLAQQRQQHQQAMELSRQQHQQQQELAQQQAAAAAAARADAAAAQLQQHRQLIQTMQMQMQMRAQPAGAAANNAGAAANNAGAGAGAGPQGRGLGEQRRMRARFPPLGQEAQYSRKWAGPFLPAGQEVTFYPHAFTSKGGWAEVSALLRPPGGALMAYSGVVPQSYLEPYVQSVAPALPPAVAPGAGAGTPPQG